MHRKLSKAKTAFAALETAVESGDATECTAALGECCTAAAAYAEAKAHPPKAKAGAKPVTAEDTAEVTAILDRLGQKCAAAQAASPAPPAPEGGQVGALWDGTLFKRLVAALPAIIAIFKELFGTTA